MPKSKIQTEIVRNSISEVSTYYHLKISKSKINQSESKDEFHDGPFHIQFVFKSIELLESFLEKNSVNYKWILPQNSP